LREAGLVPDGVQPSHGWRHRFKTVARELGLSDRTIDAIQGHAGRTAGDNYGDVTLTAKARAIDAFPDYDLTP
jgi:integrase